MRGHEQIRRFLWQTLQVAAVVEERRAKLEHYLQTVMSNLAEQGFGLDQDTMDLHSDPTREALTNAIHFFRFFSLQNMNIASY